MNELKKLLENAGVPFKKELSNPEKEALRQTFKDKRDKASAFGKGPYQKELDKLDGVKEDVDDDLRYAEKYGDEDLDWGDELIEDLKLLLSEVENPWADDGQLKNGLIDLISQYDRSDD